jgi:uncharacterized protein with von Willebrand factor type A (vWA) domain
MRLWSPKRYALGFIVSERDIEANPEKITTITRMGPIQNIKGVQRIMGFHTALSRFISHLSERGLPIYRLLKKSNRFMWIAEAQEALDKLKELLMKAQSWSYRSKGSRSCCILQPPRKWLALLLL